jgi:NADH dehydrogenase [ubiquinone] 1 alpha subcomplex assembly factor 7
MFFRCVHTSSNKVGANNTARQKTEEGWREVFVNVDPTPTETTTPSGLTLALSRDPSTLSDVLPGTSPRFDTVPVGGRVEISKDSYEMMRMVGELVSGARSEAEEEDGKGGVGGAGLVVDYGKDGFSSNSFRVSLSRSGSRMVFG